MFSNSKKVAHEAYPSVSLMFLPHFDVICDVLLNRRTATWNLFVKLTTENHKIQTKIKEQHAVIRYQHEAGLKYAPE